MKMGNPVPVHPRLRPYVEIIDWLTDMAAESAGRTAGKLKRRPPRRGQALQPGADTPLWNELVRQVTPLLRKRGSKVHLARILGVPKQRLHVCLKAGTGCLDAERTLLADGMAVRPPSRTGTRLSASDKKSLVVY